MKQLTLDDLLADAPHNSTQTSRAAAREIKPFVSGLRRRVLEYVKSRGVQGATADEIECDLHMAGSTVRPRLVELRESLIPCIADSHLTRKTRSGRNGAVYIYLRGIL